MIYIFIIILLTYYAILHDIKGINKNKKQHLNVVFVIFFLLAGLRHGIGGDTYQFRIFWDLLPSWENVTWEELTSYRYEIGWVLLSFLLKSIFGSFVSLQILLSLLLNMGIFKILKKYCPYPFIVLLIFFTSIDQFFHIECTFMRQAYAVAIFLLFGFEHLINRKYTKYFFVIILCTFLHFSSLALVILPLFWSINWENKKNIRRFIIMAIYFFLITFILLNYTSLSQIKTLLRFQQAIGSASDKIEENELIRFFNVNYYLIFYVGFILWGYKKFGLSIPFKGGLYFTILIMILAPYVGDFMRLIFFIIVLIDISISIIIAKFSRKNSLRFLTCMILFFTIPNILNFQRYTKKDNIFFIYPYYSWFEEEPKSHKDYFRQRINDNYTISHQIYDYNKTME